MNTQIKKNSELKEQRPNLIAAFIGGIFCVFCDYFLKNQSSLVNSIIQTMSLKLVIPVMISFLIITFLLPLLSMGLCFVFEPKNKITAFYIGASILSFAFNFTPLTEYDQLKTQPNSAKVSITLIEPANKAIDSVLVTVVDQNNNKIVGKSKFRGRNFSFYLNNGNYQITVEIDGYDIITENIQIADDAEKQLRFSLQSAFTPLPLQRLSK